MSQTDAPAVGIVGLGGMGKKHARHLRDDGCTVAGGADVAESARNEFASEFGAHTDADHAAMYDAVDPDAVVVTTPNTFHAPAATAALERGIDVLCEKPVVVETEAAERLRDRVADSELTFMAGYQRHLNPGFVAARERYHEEGLEPDHVTGELTQDWTGHFESGTNWRTDPDVGGRGHLFSVGTHVLESVLWVTGLTPTAVSAEMDFHDDAGHIDKRASLTVRFANGAVGSFADSAVAPVTREHVHVWDDAGAAYIDGEDWGQRRLTVIDGDGTEREPDLAYDEAPSKFAAFAEAVQTGEDPPATAGDVLTVTALLDAAYESARTRERVTVDLP